MIFGMDVDPPTFPMVWTQAARLLELALLDRSSAQELLLEAVHGNAAADDAIRRDWAPSEGAWMERHGGKAPRGRSSKWSFYYNYYYYYYYILLYIYI